MSEPRSGFVTCNGIRLHYLDWGGRGAPVMILHATGMLGRVYRPIAEALRSVGHVFSLDQRGHGDSDRSSGTDYSWYATMEDLGAFIVAMGFTNCLAFGHSAGATAIGSLASERPGLVARAVLAEPVLFEKPDGPELGWRNPFIDRTLKRKRVFDSVDAMFRNFENKPPYSGWRKDMLRDYCEYGTRPTADGKRELKCAPEIEARFYETSRDFDGLSRILGCNVPLLAMLGQRGDSLGAVFSERLSKDLKSGRVINFPEAGHFLPMEFPDQVSEKAVEFLSAQSV